LIKTIEEHGFKVVSMRRDVPCTSLKYLLFQLAQYILGLVKNSLFDRLGFLQKIFIRVPLPDVYEYICVKREDV
tara:strand:+ start:434 stop:655 length:222 start_codon:yes stop_codon:yes gene_type:complete